MIVAGALAIAYFAWFRHSSLVAVRDVKVEGLSGPDAGKITSSLTDAAHGMSTLDVDAARLRGAVSGFPVVASLSADASFPHGLTIQVAQREPVMVASDGKREVAVAADGFLLPGVQASRRLPRLRVDSLRASGRIGGPGLSEARALGATPAPLRPLIAGAGVTHDYGVVVTLRGGIAIRLGNADRPAAQWAAAAAVLADPKLTSLAYVDVRIPERPAVGG
jgi:cell division protein FtsQ